MSSTASSENVLPFYSVQDWTCFCSPGWAVNCREQVFFSGHAEMRKSKGWQGFGELLWYRICGCDIPSSSGAEDGGRTQASGQEHANADLWLQQEERNLFASYPSLPPLSNRTDSSVSRCQKFQNHFFWIAGYGTTNFHGNVTLKTRILLITYCWKKNCHQHPTHCTCVYPAQVWEIRLAPDHLSCLIRYNYWLPAI